MDSSFFSWLGCSQKSGDPLGPRFIFGSSHICVWGTTATHIPYRAHHAGWLRNLLLLNWLSVKLLPLQTCSWPRSSKHLELGQCQDAASRTQFSDNWSQLKEFYWLQWVLSLSLRRNQEATCACLHAAKSLNTQLCTEACSCVIIQFVYEDAWVWGPKWMYV